MLAVDMENIQINEIQLKDFLAQKRGRASGLAKGLSVTPVTVHEWANGGVNKVPTNRCPDIESLTDGAVTCDVLRNDCSWVRVPDSSWPHPNGRPLVDYSKKVG